VEPDDAIDGDIVESWIRIEIDPVPRRRRRQQLHNEVRRVLTDVRDAVEDAADASAGRGHRDELAAARGSDAKLRCPTRTSPTRSRLLKWLAHDHFTFLGYRSTHSATASSAPCRAAGSASCARPEHPARAVDDGARGIPAGNGETPAGDHQGQLAGDGASLGLSGLHRRQDLRQQWQRVGERRFLGLFSSSAYRTSVRELPVVRRKVMEVLDRSGLSPRGHSGKDLLQILETYPRDELFQIKTDDRTKRSSALLRMAGRPPVCVSSCAGTATAGSSPA